MCIICECLKNAKQRPDSKGQPGGKFADPVTFFFRKPGEIIDATLLQRGVDVDDDNDGTNKTNDISIKISRNASLSALPVRQGLHLCLEKKLNLNCVL